DIEGAIAIIKNGGAKAQSWLKDKIDGKFAIPALYHSRSKIPLDVWQASPLSTNRNEQAHRNINRDGINLTLLGGIMHRMHYD
ncbi:hypothetical protein BDQ17DRAFT_1193339, partial [Cyathus striatus]